MYIVECDLNSTENSELLIEKLKIFFPDADFKIKSKKIIGESNIERLESISKKQEASFILEEIELKKKTNLDKLAMYDGVVEPDEGFPLGKITIKLKE